MFGSRQNQTRPLRVETGQRRLAGYPKINERTCPTCNGTGFPKVKQPAQAGRKLYPVKCEACAGKGKLPTLATETALLLASNVPTSLAHALDKSLKLAVDQRRNWFDLRIVDKDLLMAMSDERVFGVWHCGARCLGDRGPGDVGGRRRASCSLPSKRRPASPTL